MLLIFYKHVMEQNKSSIHIIMLDSTKASTLFIIFIDH